MEANICDLNHLDNGNVLLPPRKRLLAGLKKQNSIANSHQSLRPATTSTEFNLPLSNLLCSQLNNPSPSPQDIVQASKTAAEAALKVAGAARAAAKEKAAVAVRAVAAAKSALELVASLSEEATASKDRFLKRNKLKKHPPVRLLYKKHQPIENYKDEELALKLHRDMNSSIRVSKNREGSKLKNHNLKKPKIPHKIEKAKVSNKGVELGKRLHSMCNEHAVASGEEGSEGFIPIQEVCTVEADEKLLKLLKTDQLEVDSGDAEVDNSVEKISEALDDACATGKKRGPMKLKNLPLSICALTSDQVNPGEEMKSRPPSMDLLSMESSADDGVMSVEETQVWKQALMAPECLEQSKVMQS